MMQCTLATGVDPEAGNPHGDTPLTGAVFLGHTKAVEVLPKFGADLTSFDYLHQTALFTATIHNRTG
jgi:ankyrin repeat protein